MKTIIIILLLFSAAVFAADEKQIDVCEQLKILAGSYHDLAQVTKDVDIYEGLVEGTLSDSPEVVRSAALSVADLAWMTRNSLTKNMFQRLSYEACAKVDT